MKLTALSIITIILVSLPSFSQSNENEAWLSLNGAVQTHTYPERGRMARQALPDYKNQGEALAKTVVKAKGTSAEPVAMFYLGNTYFQLERFAEAKAVLADLKSRFPNHGLCRTPGEGVEEKSPADEAIDDVDEEIELRKTYRVTKLPHAIVDLKQSAIMHTSHGDLDIGFFTNVAPKTVENFKKLAKSGFYNDSYFHYVATFRKIIGGCPNTKNRKREDDGQGSPGYSIEFERSDALHTLGSISMNAQSDGSAHGSQFTVCVNDQPDLNNKQAVFARVTKGHQFLRKMSQERADDNNNPYTGVIIRSIEWIEN